MAAEVSFIASSSENDGDQFSVMELSVVSFLSAAQWMGHSDDCGENRQEQKQPQVLRLALRALLMMTHHGTSRENNRRQREIERLSGG
jgi:hypothetical protein